MDYRTDAPAILRDFLVYHETIQNHSRKTVDEYFLDLRNFFRYLKIQRRLVPADTPMDSISIDDIDFTLNGMPLKKCGSQGQQKSFLVALKLAQFEIMKNLHGTAPILLLDDVFDKLDMQRVEYRLQLVASDAFGQIFISDSNKVRMASIVERFTSECSSFEVTGGVYTKL